MAFRSVIALLVCALSAASAFVPAVASLQMQQQQQLRSAVSMGVPSAEKPKRVNERNRIYNKGYRSEMRTKIKTVLASVEEGDYAKSSAALNACFKIIDKNVKRNIVHKNTAARKKSQLHLKVKKLEGGDAAAAPAPAAAESE